MNRVEQTKKDLRMLEVAAEAVMRLKKESEKTNLTLPTGDLAPNGKEYRVYKRKELMDFFNVGRKMLKNYVEDFNQTHPDAVIPFDESPGWDINAPQFVQLKAHIFPQYKLSTTAILVVTNLKGGSGKTIASITQAVGLATECKTNYRILLVDLDPQKTSTEYLAPNFDPDEGYSFGEIMELESNGELDVQTMNEAILDTHFPNLKFLPASMSSSMIEDLLRETKEGNPSIDVGAVLQRALELVKDQFDIILLDTPPQLNGITINALYAANAVVIPFSPSFNDQTATTTFLKRFRRIFNNLAEKGHQGYHFTRLLVSNYQANSLSEKRAVSPVSREFSPWLFDNVIKQSEAIKTCSQQARSVFCLAPSQYNGRQMTLKDAQYDVRGLIFEMECLLVSEFGTEPLEANNG